jgi:hypothetical protein
LAHWGSRAEVQVESLEVVVRGPVERLPVTQEAVAVYRDLAAVSPDRYRHDLVGSLALLAAICEAPRGHEDDADCWRAEAAELSESGV